MSINYGCNENEYRVLKAFEGSPVLTLAELSEVCPSGTKDATSWVRNSLRKPVRHGFVVKVSRGTYAVTDKLASFDGSKAAEARREAHLSQESIRVMIGASSRQRVSDLERGQKRPSLTEVYALGAALRTVPTSFFPSAEEGEVKEVVAA